MPVPSKISKALNRFQWSVVEDHLLSFSPAERWGILNEIITEVFQEGFLTLRRPDPAKEAMRDAFVTALQHEVEESDAFLEAKFHQGIVNSRVIERLYRELLHELDEQILSKIGPEQLATALISLTTKEMPEWFEAAYSQTRGKKSLDVFGFRIQRESSGSRHQPDHVIYSGALVLGSTLKMLAFKNGWLKDGRIELPSTDLDEGNHLGHAKKARDLAAIWNCLESSESANRYFGGDIFENNVQSPVSPEEIITVTTIMSDVMVERDFLVADERLRIRLFSYLTDLRSRNDIQERINRSLPAMHAPEEFLSVEEAHDWVSLSELILLPVEDSTEQVGGLMLREWIRAYAVLRKKAKEHLGHSQKSRIPFIISETALCSSLQAHGLTKASALQFIENASFGREGCDLFDAPLVRIRDGKLYFASFAANCLLGARAILSQCASFKRHFDEKGAALESDVKECFSSLGIPTASMRLRAGSDEGQIDCIALWDDYLFVIECKSYALPNESQKSKYYFLKHQSEAAQQVLRQADIVMRVPDEVSRHLGTQQKWSKVIPIVLNAMPFSREGIKEGVYFYDYSALRKFLDDGQVRLTSHAMHFRKQGAFSGVRKRLWKRDRPSAADFVAQMEHPIQNTVIAAHYKLGPLPVPISPSKWMVTCGIDRNETAIEGIRALLKSRTASQ